LIHKGGQTTHIDKSIAKEEIDVKDFFEYQAKDSPIP